MVSTSKRLDRITFSRATIFEWPQIEKLRRAYFQSRGQTVQRRGNEASWWVARIGQKVVGCCSTVHALEFGQLWGLDFYRCAGRDGVLAAIAMSRELEEMADAEDLALCFYADPGNEAWIEKAAGRGYTPVAVSFLRQKRSERCPRQQPFPPR